MFTYENAKIITTNILNKATNLTTFPIMAPEPANSLTKWKRTMLTQKGTIHRECDHHHARPSSHLGWWHMLRPRRRPATVQAPLTNRTFLTTSRSLGYHSKSIAREEGRGKGGKVRAKVSKQELYKGKTRDQTSQCREVKRWKQRMKLVF